MRHVAANPVVHVVLHTGNLARACAFYGELFGWTAELINAGNGSYLALELGDYIGGGVVECDTRHPLWLPYVEVTDIRAATDVESNGRLAVVSGRLRPCSPGRGARRWRG